MFPCSRRNVPTQCSHVPAGMFPLNVPMFPLRVPKKAKNVPTPMASGRDVPAVPTVPTKK